jgi:outer membrane protein assembly factor BamB
LLATAAALSAAVSACTPADSAPLAKALTPAAASSSTPTSTPPPPIESTSPPVPAASSTAVASPTPSVSMGVTSAAAVPVWPPAPAVGAVGALAAHSDPSVLPGPILIADKNNNRLLVVDPQGRVVWQWPQPGDLAPGQSFLIPDDAFFSPDGRDIIVTQEDDFVVTEIDIATRKIVWRYGHPGHHGSAAGYLWNPDDAMMLPSGLVVAADIKNCRLVELLPGAPSPVWTAGQVGGCKHNPPSAFGSPNGMFPLPDGHFLVTEINNDWVDEVNLAGQVSWSAHPPMVSYPSDTNQYKPGQYLTVDYSSRGQVVIFDATGKTLWRWNPSTGNGRLNHPSLAVPLPNGDILLNDDRNDRVIVIDPRTDSIVWQYGHTGVAGSSAGYLNNPDGLDPAPPSSYADAVNGVAR